MTMFGRLRRAGRALAGVDESRLEGRLKEISDRLTKLEESVANLKPNIKMLPAIVRRLYLDDADLPPPYDLLSERFHYLSQNEEDGLLLALFKRIGMTNRRAVEIGCGLNGGNSGFLVQECGWNGLMVDANRHKIDTIKLRFSGHAATVVKHRVTRDDVNTLLATHGFTGEIDFLSIDVDGIDYWVWEAITACSPRVVALEYNWLFGPDKSVTVPYDGNFEVGSTGTRSYRGASLTALVISAVAKDTVWWRASASTRSLFATMCRRQFPRSMWPAPTARRRTSHVPTMCSTRSSRPGCPS